MYQIYFHIYEGKPLSPEDNREEVNELHILVEFNAPEVHAELMDYIDRWMAPVGEALEYVRDTRTGKGIIDVAFKPGITGTDGILKVKSAAVMFCQSKRLVANTFLGKPTC